MIDYFRKNIYIKLLLYGIGIITISSCCGCLEDVNYAEIESKQYVVNRVIDGDTIEISNGKRIRYLGVDTPEIRRKILGEWVYDPEPFALDAKTFNSDIVLRKKVKLEFDVEKKDKYGRWLAYVYVDDVMVNLELLKNGYAKVLIIPPNIKYQKNFSRTQEQAKIRKAGLWQAM